MGNCQRSSSKWIITVEATYLYNAWGELLSSSGVNNLHNVNPLRYRGKYFDQSTGLYYLQSRFYDPMIGRFINWDGLLSTGQGFLGLNMFTFCLNNPVNLEDQDGYRGTPATQNGRNRPAAILAHRRMIARINARVRARNGIPPRTTRPGNNLVTQVRTSLGRAVNTTAQRVSGTSTTANATATRQAEPVFDRCAPVQICDQWRRSQQDSFNRVADPITVVAALCLALLGVAIAVPGGIAVSVAVGFTLAFVGAVLAIHATGRVFNWW